jgi:hypothetical protein
MHHAERDAYTCSGEGKIIEAIGDEAQLGVSIPAVLRIHGAIPSATPI